MMGRRQIWTCNVLTGAHDVDHNLGWSVFTMWIYLRSLSWMRACLPVSTVQVSMVFPSRLLSLSGFHGPWLDKSSSMSHMIRAGGSTASRLLRSTHKGSLTCAIQGGGWSWRMIHVHVHCSLSAASVQTLYSLLSFFIFCLVIIVTVSCAKGKSCMCLVGSVLRWRFVNPAGAADDSSPRGSLPVYPGCRLTAVRFVTTTSSKSSGTLVNQELAGSTKAR